MADHTIAADQVGVYEIPLTAGNATTISVEDRGWHISSILQLSVHDASMPVYARVGNTTSVKDPESAVVLNGQWIELRTPYSAADDATIAIISAADATISLARA